MLSRYRGKTKCQECHGKRLRKEANNVKVGEVSISELVELSIESLTEFFESLSLTTFETQISGRLLKEINTRLDFLQKVGLGYLSLNRKSNTLSGGESQRINLATSLGSSLVGSMYILDEPSIGLHPKDTERLIVVLQKLFLTPDCEVNLVLDLISLLIIYHEIILKGLFFTITLQEYRIYQTYFIVYCTYSSQI